MPFSCRRDTGIDIFCVLKLVQQEEQCSAAAIMEKTSIAQGSQHSSVPSTNDNESEDGKWPNDTF
jgi:hypothetical protein